MNKAYQGTLFWIVVLFAFGSFSFCAFAQDKPAPALPETTVKPPKPKKDLSWLNDITRIPPGENKDLPPVYCSFNLSWNNVLNAGKLEVGINKGEIEQSTPAYLGGASGKSSGVARALWPYDFEAASIVREENLRPVAFDLRERERDKLLEYEILFDEKKLTCATTKPDENGETRETIVEATYKHDFGQDLFSAVLYLRSLPLNDGDVVSMVVTPFSRPYLVKFIVEGRETHRVKGKKHDAIKVSIELGKIKKDLTIENYDKMKTATVWISEDEFRLPLEIQADVFVGFISAKMTERRWIEQEGNQAAAAPKPATQQEPGQVGNTAEKPEVAPITPGEVPGSAPDKEKRRLFQGLRDRRKKR